MKNYLVYKDYHGTVEYSAEDDCLFGQIVGIADLISYEGQDVASLKQDFENAVDDYLALCKQLNKEPQKAYKGSFNVRVSPDLHRKLDLIAQTSHQTLNSVVTEALTSYAKQQNSATR
ncbi:MULTISPECIES: type II toxin-antitoxin system HicB family antitoxin [Caproicibacterium]|uniref:Type II toxin-antitoxin system HicB family antitoxin n=1 Tax=Caproicibacterium argilliputei TaxID=3030016 RepID=A0AA97H1E5_9FIRM|nr:type II toxin-antitoxin system HicB family antitoxin [Caproicibacterium argilliputei]WOC32353.1 type II toxin-antitoxin system HicB family antitoxin [Caproicibacterium argilliputei]